MSTGNSTITNDYNQLISFSGYDPGHSYDAEFWQATHDAGNTLYQDLASAPGADFHANSVPEPSSFAMGAAALFFLAAIVNRRRARRGRKAR